MRLCFTTACIGIGRYGFPNDQLHEIVLLTLNCQQLTRINAVFSNSSALFDQASIADVLESHLCDCFANFLGESPH
jgi:hypothetical protein